MLRRDFIICVILSIFLVCGHGSSTQGKSPRVNTETGIFEGSILATRLGKTIYAFRGIRYAEAPVGELRFKVSFVLGFCFITHNLLKEVKLCVPKMITW